MHVCVWCTHETIVLKLKEEDEINHIIIIISSLTTLGLLFFDFILKWWSFGNRSEDDKICISINIMKNETRQKEEKKITTKKRSRNDQ